MVNHHAAAGRQQGWQQVRQALGLQVQLHMPAQGVGLLQHAVPTGRIQIGQRQADQVQAHAHHAGIGQGLQLFIARALIHHGHAAQALRLGVQRLEQVAVVRAQKAGLHQHAMGQAVRVQVVQIGAQERILVGRIAARIRHGQATLEDMGVGIDAGRNGEPGHGRHGKNSLWVAPRKARRWGHGAGF